MNTNYDELQKRLGYKFKEKKYLLERALTHSSFANESKGKEKDYERLEFLGDAVLELVVSDYLFRNNKDISEGELTKTRASLVCETSLSNISRKIGLGEFLRLSKGEENNRGREHSSVLCDVFESVVAAIYLDGGFKSAQRFILSMLREQLGSKQDEDYKTQLQEAVQEKLRDKARLSYEIVSETGPDHAKYFYVHVRRGSKVIGRGEGKSKKQAEQNAAKEALGRIGDFL